MAVGYVGIDIHVEFGDSGVLPKNYNAWELIEASSTIAQSVGFLGFIYLPLRGIIV